MGYNGAGIYSLPVNSLVSDGTSADAADLNTPLSDIATALSQAFIKDGRAAATGDWDMGGYKITDTIDGTSATGVSTVQQAQKGVLREATTVGGTVDAIQVAFTPATTTWTTHEKIRWTSAGANTITGATISKDSGSSNKTILRPDGTALVVGDLGPSGAINEGVYNGTNVILTTIPHVSVVKVGANNAFTGDNSHAGSEAFNGSWVTKEQTLVITSNIAAWNMGIGPDAVVTLPATTTALAAPTNQKLGARGQLRIVQDGTGGRAFTWDTTYVTDKGYVPSIYPGINAETVFDYWCKAASGAGSIVLRPRGANGPHVIIEDQKAANTVGQSLISGLTTRVLNTLVYNLGTLASLASNQFTLPAGTYYIDAITPVSNSGSAVGTGSVGFRALVYNVTDAAYAINGQGMTNNLYYNVAGNPATTINALAKGVVTITAAKIFEIRNFCTIAQTGGYQVNDGRGEVYTHVEITKLS